MDSYFPSLLQIGARGDTAAPAAPTLPREQEGSFQQQLVQALEQVNQQLHVADHMNQQMLLGQVHDVSQVMIEATKAQLALELTIQLRNKVLEAYQDIMRMQI